MARTLLDAAGSAVVISVVSYLGGWPWMAGGAAIVALVTFVAFLVKV